VLPGNPGLIHGPLVFLNTYFKNARYRCKYTVVALGAPVRSLVLLLRRWSANVEPRCKKGKASANYDEVAQDSAKQYRGEVKQYSGGYGARKAFDECIGI